MSESNSNRMNLPFLLFFLCAYVEIIPHAKFFIIFFILCAVNFWVVLLVLVAGNVVTLCKHMFFFDCTLMTHISS